MLELLTGSVYFGVLLSLGTFALGLWLKRKFHAPLFNPLLVSVVLTILVLLVLGMDYDTYYAGAGNHQERQRPLNPFRPFPHKQRWNQRQQQCGQANRRSIPTGKTGNKPFRARLAFSGILHQAQNPRHCGAFVGAGGTQAKHPRLIHATAEHGIPLGNIPGNGFSRKGGCVEG